MSVQGWVRGPIDETYTTENEEVIRPPLLDNYRGEGSPPFGPQLSSLVEGLQCLVQTLFPTESDSTHTVVTLVKW